MKRMNIFILAIVLITTIVISSIYLEKTNSNGNDSNYPITSYTVEVISTSEVNQTILIPFPSANGQAFYDVYHNLNISTGNVSYSISNSSKGFDSFGLNVTFTNSFELKWESEIDLFYYLSMENRTSQINDSWYDENPEWYIYFGSQNNNNITINIRYEIDYGYEMKAFYINGEITDGWNKIIGRNILRYD